MVAKTFYSLLFIDLQIIDKCILHPVPWYDVIISPFTINFSQKSPPWKAFLVAIFGAKILPYLREEQNMLNEDLHKNLSTGNAVSIQI